jgi:hypothetical protein
MLKGRIETSGRQSRKSSSSTSTSKTPKAGNDPEDPDGEARRGLDGAEEMRRLGLEPRLAAAVVGVSASTVRRWCAARRRGQPLRRRRGPARAVPNAAQVVQAVDLVREMNGLMGAASLARSTGLSRRQAAAIKRTERTAMERERQDFPDLSRKAPRVVVYSGSSKVQTRIDQVGSKGYAVGFQGLVRFIMQQLPQNEVIEDALRKEVKLAPEITIRELVANALIHQDLSIGGTSVMIEVYDNRVEISNPGEPIVPAERFIDGYQSRNERLADLMRRMRICEEKGSGVDKVVQAAEAFQLPAPLFHSGSKRVQVTLFGPKEFEDMDRGDRIRACYQHCVLRWVMAERMTNQSLRERFRLPESKSAIVSQIISATTADGLIKPDESVGASKKYARYLPAWA